MNPSLTTRRKKQRPRIGNKLKRMLLYRLYPPRRWPILPSSPPLENLVTKNLDHWSLFGFAVVKVSNAFAAAVGKKPHIDLKPANQHPKDAPPVHTAQPIRKIVDVPEMASS